mgnify:CR=1 FL=1
MDIKKDFQNYLANDMDGLKSLWSSDLKVYPNSTEAVSLDELVGMLEAQHNTFSPITMTFGGEDSEANAFVETTSYPDTPVSEASTWSQAWFTWNATSKLTGEMISLPAHISNNYDHMAHSLQDKRGPSTHLISVHICRCILTGGTTQVYSECIVAHTCAHCEGGTLGVLRDACVCVMHVRVQRARVCVFKFFTSENW